jgi:hypothetical protein
VTDCLEWLKKPMKTSARLASALSPRLQGKEVELDVFVTPALDEGMSGELHAPFGPATVVAGIEPLSSIRY